jgi:hypothetical protein
MVRTDTPNREMLNKLFNNEIAAIVVPAFTSQDRCQLAAKAVLAHGIEFYKDVYPKIGKVGITQFEYNRDLVQKNEYFTQARHADAMRRQLFAESGDFVPEVITFFKDAWCGDAQIAMEEDTHQAYFAGLIRVLPKQLLLHYDWAPVDGPNWAICHIAAQLTWNVFLQTGSSGGATIVYKRPWPDESDERYAVAGSYGFDSAAVKGADFVKLPPRVGDLVIFNSRNFHEVEETLDGTDRITVSSFVGLLESQNKLVFWS